MARIVVTGAHGFIGRHLARHLAAEGHDIGGLGHGHWPSGEARPWGVTSWVNGDITSANLSLLRQEMGAPEFVYHLAGGSSVGAAIRNPREDFFRTAVSTAELLDWVRLQAPAAGIIAISSAAVYGAGHDGPIPETAEPRPSSTYGHHKLIMEKLCRTYSEGFGLRIAISRLFSVYGPGLRKQLLFDICTRLEDAPETLQLGGSGAELRDWTHIDDVVRALSFMMHMPSLDLPILNVGSGRGISVLEIASRLIEAWHAQAGPCQKTRLSFSGQSRPGDPFSLVASPRRLSSIGFTFEQELDQGLGEVVDWYRTHSKTTRRP